MFYFNRNNANVARKFRDDKRYCNVIDRYAFEKFLEKNQIFFIYNCGLGGSLFTLRLRRAISHDERELRRWGEKEGITREAQRSDDDERLCCGWCIFQRVLIIW